MGVTSKSISIIQMVLNRHAVKSVVDLGAQNNYEDHVIRSAPAKYPYMSEWWKARGVHYESIDLNGENGCHVLDLTKPIDLGRRFDLVCDFGTSEHVSKEGYYQCHKNIDSLCEVGGYIIHANPKVGNWPGHGNNYVDQDFYKALAVATNYYLIHLEEWPAMGNTTDGWEVITVLKKNNEFKITKEQWANIHRTTKTR